jgi:hypothetical protein
MLGERPSIPKNPFTLGTFHCVAHAADSAADSAVTGSIKGMRSNCIGRAFEL